MSFSTNLWPILLSPKFYKSMTSKLSFLTCLSIMTLIWKIWRKKSKRGSVWFLSNSVIWTDLWPGKWEWSRSSLLIWCTTNYCSSMPVSLLWWTLQVGGYSSFPPALRPTSIMSLCINSHFCWISIKL